MRKERLPVKPWPRLDRFKEHDIELPVARLGISTRGEADLRQKLAEALQYGKGVVQVFRRGESIYESARLPLRGLDPASSYSITNLDPGEPRSMSGRELMEKGLPVSLTARPDSAIYTYRLQR